jgi:hypothetical protein
MKFSVITLILSHAIENYIELKEAMITTL